MATKTDYYNRIISSLQSEITGLKTTVSELQKEMEEMRKALKEGSERNATVQHIPVESHPVSLSLKTLLRKEVEILISKMKAVCDEAIKANHENYVEMFVMRSELDSLREHIETTFLSIEKFRDYRVNQRIWEKAIEKKLRRPFSLLTINSNYSTKHHPSKDSFTILYYLDNIKELINFEWLRSILVFVIIGLLVAYLISSVQ